MKLLSFLDKMTIKKRLILLTVSVSFIFLLITEFIAYKEFNTQILDAHEEQIAHITELALGTLKKYQ